MCIFIGLGLLRTHLRFLISVSNDIFDGLSIPCMCRRRRIPELFLSGCRSLISILDFGSLVPPYELLCLLQAF